MNRAIGGGMRIGIVLISWALIFAGPLAAQPKKLQIIADKAEIHLDADAKSPVVGIFAKGTTITLASAVKTRTNWLYVFFVSAKSGQTRSGYILESQVRRLFQDLRVIEISSGGESTQPAEIDFNESFKPVVDWGSSQAKIVRFEGRPDLQEEVNGRKIIRYKRRIMAKNCYVEYVFDRDQLVATRYQMIENYADNNRYIDEYKKIKDYLVSKIGEPRSDKIVWQDPSLMNDNQSWGTALSLGKLEFHSEWESLETGTEIMMTLAGGDSRIVFGAELSGLKFKTASF